jgi:hypothetical protein
VIEREFVGTKRGEFDIGNTASEGLGRLPQQLARCGAQQEEPARMPRGIDLGAQLGEESGQVLDFVKDHKLLAVARQEDGGLGEHRPVAEALEVEEDGVRALGRDGAGESCLADLAWSEEYDAGKLGQPGAERSCKALSIIHAF